MTKGKPIQGKIFEYFSTRPNWAVHLPELAASLGETDLNRVRVAVNNMRLSKKEYGEVEIIQRGLVWKWIPRQGSGLPGSNDPTAKPVTEANPLLEGLLEEGQRQDELLLHGTGDGMPFPDIDPMEAARAFTRAIMTDTVPKFGENEALGQFHATLNREVIPTRAEYEAAARAVERGVDRPVKALAMEYAQRRLDGFELTPAEEQGFPKPSVESFTMDKPRGAFENPETMFVRIGTAENGDALLKDEDGQIWRASRV